MGVELVRKLAHEVFVPDQVIMAEGELGDAMYFVIRGTLRVTAGGVRVAVLYDGDHFGEACLISNEEPRSATVTADSFCELFVLHTTDFVEGRDFAQQTAMPFSPMRGLH